MNDMMIALGHLAITLSVALAPPIIGTVVRFRVHYDPKDEEQSRIGPPISSFFGMMRSVHRIEGWTGLYKGSIPMLLTFTLFLIIFCVTDCLMTIHGVPNISGTGAAVGIFSYSIVAILFLPLVVITNRAITTTHKLPYYDAIYSLDILLTPAERRRPWILYCTPGLFAAQAAHVFNTFLLGIHIYFLIVPSEIPYNPYWLRLCNTVMLKRTILTPLEVIVTRLSIQRNNEASEGSSLGSQDVENGGRVMKRVHFSFIPVIGFSLRTDREPYVGLIDCVKKINEEEGLSPFYRAWWLPTF